MRNSANFDSVRTVFVEGRASRQVTDVMLVCTPMPAVGATIYYYFFCIVHLGAATERIGTMQNKRRFVRVRPSGLMSRTGKIFANLGAPAIDCDIVDISAGGACIVVHGASEIPKKFILLYGGAKKSCRLVWLKGRRIGLSF